MSADQLRCHCGKPVERRSGAGRPPRTCLDCREPYRDRKRVQAEGSGYVPAMVKTPKPPRPDWRTLAGLPPVQPATEQVPYGKRNVPLKAVVPERVKVRGGLPIQGAPLPLQPLARKPSRGFEG